MFSLSFRAVEVLPVAKNFILKGFGTVLDVSRFHSDKMICLKAYLELGDFENALKFLKAAQAKKPYDTDINNLLKKVAM